ncbi:MAG: hypothetical protein ABIP93_16225 [Gemmatimonadaceae bacterium]
MAAEGLPDHNYDYPVRPIVSGWHRSRPDVPLTKATAPAYVAAVKKFIERDMSGLISDPLHWSPKQVGWYDMPWGGRGSMMPNGKVDPSTGREALLGSYTGQVLQSNSYPVNQRPSVKSFQNHAVVYYNDVAAHHLGIIWKNPFKPDLSDTQYPDGSIAMKVEGVTLAEDQWPTQGGPQRCAAGDVGEQRCARLREVRPRLGRCRWSAGCGTSPQRRDRLRQAV